MTPTRSPAGSSPKVLAVLVALGGTALAAMVGFVSLVAASFAFDSPARTTSTTLVGGLLLGGVSGEAVAAWIAGVGVALRGAHASRIVLGCAVAVGAVAAAVHVAAMGLALFGR